MLHSPSRDRIETESLSPEEGLRLRRQSRDEAEYREFCETSDGMLELGGEILHPADVLDKCAPDAARRGRAEVKAQVRKDVEELVCEQFPAPIAIPFHRFMEGPRPPLTRLLNLRDTWEGLVRLLAALALAEAATVTSSFSPLELRESEAQGFRKCKRRDLRSDRLSIRIGLIEAVLRRAGQIGVPLELIKLLPMDVLAEIRRLNVIRNGFAHDATKSDKQAEEIIEETYPVVLELLVDLREMQNIELFRISKIVPGNDCATAEVELLVGHAQSQRFRDVELDDSATRVAMLAGNVEELHRVLASVGKCTLDLSPNLYTTVDESGHRTRLLVFKCCKEGKWHMECVADSSTEALPETAHRSLLERFYDLLEKNGD